MLHVQTVCSAKIESSFHGTECPNLRPRHLVQGVGRMYPLYQDASTVLELMEKRKGTANRLSLNTSIRNKKACLAVAAETSRYANVLQECMEAAGIDQQQHEFKPWLIKVLVYELLLGNKKITGGGAGPRLVKGSKDRLMAALASILKRQGASSAFGLLPESERARMAESLSLPKYARVNTFKTSVEEVRATLAAAGWEECSYPAFLQAMDAEVQDQTANGDPVARRKHRLRIFALDKDLDDVLLLPPGPQLAHDDPLLLSCSLRLQDKASCLPAHVLTTGPQPLAMTLDACAAPGNKTTHLAALLNSLHASAPEGSGHKGSAKCHGGSSKKARPAGSGAMVIALDVDKRRCQLLQETVDLMGASECVSVMHQDFLEIDSSKPPFCHVEGIMLDPSCSGSGIRGRDANEQTDFAGDDGRQRLLNLATFQAKALAHALRFPAVQRVVYSTCSIHHEEDEDVVRTCLEGAGGKFRLERILPQWQRRGLPLFDGAESCVRVTQEDRAMGFFVACLVRSDAPVSAGDAPLSPTVAQCRNFAAGRAGRPRNASATGQEVPCVSSSETDAAGSGRAEGGAAAQASEQGHVGCRDAPVRTANGRKRVGKGAPASRQVHQRSPAPYSVKGLHRLLAGGFGRCAFY